MRKKTTLFLQNDLIDHATFGLGRIVYVWSLDGKACGMVIFKSSGWKRIMLSIAPVWLVARDPKSYARHYRQSQAGKLSRARSAHKRRAKQMDAELTLTHEEWSKTLGAYNYHCAYCGSPFDKINRPTRDHVVPVSLGGGFTRENIVPACKSCNSAKHDSIWVLEY